MDQPLKGKKIAVLVETEYVPSEIKTYQERFAELGAEVHLMSRLWGQSEITFVSDVTEVGQVPENLTVNIDFNHVNIHDYAAIIMAANYTSVRLRWLDDADLEGEPITGDSGRKALAVRFFQQAMMEPKIVKGFPCHALWILAPIPEMLKGRRVICNRVMLADVNNAGGVYVNSDTGVVVDEEIVTNDSASRTPELVDAICKQILAIESGELEPKLREAEPQL